MDVDSVKKMAWNWGIVNPAPEASCPPEARFISGNPKFDARVYYFESESGIRLTLSDDFNKILSYDIIDEEKFVWFALRWT